MDKEDVKYYSSIKKDGILLFVTTWMDLKCVILSKMSENNPVVCNFTYLWDLTKQE